MTKQSYDKAAAAQRTAAYIQFLLAAYDTDLDGLADLAGIERKELLAFAEAPYAEKSLDVLAALLDLTAISAGWMFGGAPEPVAVPAVDGRAEAVRAELMAAVNALDDFTHGHARALTIEALDELVEIQRGIHSAAIGLGTEPDTASADRTDSCTASAGQADLEAAVMASHAQMQVALTALEKFVYAVHEPALDTRDVDLLTGVVMVLNRIGDDLDAAIDQI